MEMTTAYFLMAIFTDLDAVKKLTEGLEADIASGWKGGDADEYLQRLSVLKQETAAAANTIYNLAQEAAAAQTAAAALETAAAERRL